MWGDIARAVADVVGMGVSQFGGDSGARDAQSANFEFQKQMAQNGVRWRVEDAKAAGVHPLFALGAQIPAGAPVQVFGNDNDAQTAELASRFGQDIGRAIDSTRTEDERTSARMQSLALERSELQNDLLRSQIARLNQQSGPPMPVSNPYLNRGVAGTAGFIEERPMERTISSPEAPSQEPGAIPYSGWGRTATGLTPVPSKDVKERIEDMTIPELMWSMKNLLLPHPRQAPPNSALPPGYTDWEWNLFSQEWRPVRRREVYRGAIPVDEGR